MNLRQFLYEELTADQYLMAMLPGGILAPQTAAPNVKTPFIIISLSNADFSPLWYGDDRIIQVVEIYVYDRVRQRGNQLIASYQAIDQIVEKISTELNRIVEVSDGHTYYFQIADVSGDLYDDGWQMIFRRVRVTVSTFREALE